MSFLATRGRVKSYDYHFELGKTANGTNLGWGDVCINYYTDAEFARMQTWEKYVWEEVLEIACRHGYADMVTQTWTDADMACPTPLDADMAAYRQANADIHINTRRPSPSPHSQPSSNSRKLSKSRGTQAKPTLELRARLVQYLAGGGGEDLSKNSDRRTSPYRPERATEYIQCALFCKELHQDY